MGVYVYSIRKSHVKTAILDGEKTRIGIYTFAYKPRFRSDMDAQMYARVVEPSVRAWERSQDDVPSYAVVSAWAGGTAVYRTHGCVSVYDDGFDNQLEKVGHLKKSVVGWVVVI